MLMRACGRPRTISPGVGNVVKGMVEASAKLSCKVRVLS